MNVVQIAAKFYEARDQCRRLWGEKWQAEQLPKWRAYIEAAMRKHDCDELKAAMKIMQGLQADCTDSGMAQVCILAAAAEMMEPEDTE